MIQSEVQLLVLDIMGSVKLFKMVHKQELIKRLSSLDVHKHFTTSRLIVLFY